MQNSRGLSLVEIMITLALSAMVLAGALNLVSGIKTTQEVSSALTQVQENGRFALDTLSDALAQAGYYGRLQPMTYTPAEAAEIDWSNLSGRFFIKPVAVFASTNLSRTALRGFEVNSARRLSPDLSSSATPFNADLIPLQALTNPLITGSDVLSVQFASVAAVGLAQDMASETANLLLQTAGLGSLTNNPFLIIEDGGKADLFRVSNQPGTIPPILIKHALVTDINLQANLQADLRNRYNQSTAQVRRFHSDTFYVAQTGRTDALGKPVTALMRRDVQGGEAEVIEGVEFLQLLYGQETAGGRLQYLKANDAALNMNQVTQVQIGVLVKTLQSATTQPDDDDYQVLDETIGPNTRPIKHSGGPYLRKVFTRTLQLRNRS